jgi:AcrR family transcriptional regulator
MPRAGLTTERVVSEAATLADETSLESFTLAALAERLGVRLPSLYKHVAGMPALQRHLAVRAKTELTEVLARAAVGRSKGDALRAVALAYREWAREHPGLYVATMRAPGPEDTADVAASAAATQVVFDVLSGYGLGRDQMIDATRTLRAGLHGYAALEAVGGFAMDRTVAASIDWMLDALDRALAAGS